MALRRQYKILNEAIESLDQRMIQAKGDISKAWQSLSPLELQFCREEISNCISSRLYYLQNYHVIQPEQGILSILYPLYDHQHMIEEAIQKERDRCGWSKIIVLKPRQSGGTEFANAVMCHCTLFTPRAYTLTVAQNPEVATHVQRKVNTCWDSLPWWLRPERQYHSKGEYLEFQRKNELDRAFDPGLGSVFVTTHAERETGVAIGKCQIPESVIWTSLGPLTLQQIWDSFATSSPLRTDPDGGEWYGLTTPLSVYSWDSDVVALKEVTSVYRQHYRGSLQEIDVGTVRIEKTPAHAMLTTEGWRKQLRAKDLCVRVSDLPWPKYPTYLDPDEAELLGWIVGEGSESLRGNTTVIPQKNEVIRQRIFQLVAKVAQPKSIHNIKEGKRTGFVRFSSKPYKRQLITRGHVWGRRSGNKEIPPFLFSAGKPPVVRFLQALFEGEASVTHVVEVGSKSKAVIEGVKFLLARFGISLRVSAVWKKPTKRNPERYRYYRGCIGGPSLRKFADEIGFISDRKNARLARTASKVSGSNVEIAVEATHLLREACSLSGVSVKFVMGSGQYAKKQFLTRKSASESLEKLRLLCGLSDSQLSKRAWALRKFKRSIAQPYLKEIESSINSQFACERVDRVSEREYDGYVFDLEVASTHNYATSGLITHNTIRNFHGTEVSRWGSGEIFTSDIEPSMNALDTMGIMESASFDDQGFFVNMWNEAVESSEPDWVPVFLPVYRAKKYSLPIKPGVTFTLTTEEQASKDRVQREEGIVISNEFFNWRRVKIKAATKRDGNPYQHYAAYPMTAKEAFQAPGTGAFPRHKLDFQEQTFVQPPIWHGQILFQGMHAAGKFLGEEIKPGQAIPKREFANQLWIWEYAKPSETYYIGADVATGQAHDNSGAPVWRVGKGGNRDVQVAEWHGKISPTEYAKVLYALGFYYQWAELAVEYMGPGVTTGDYLFITLEYPKLYRPRQLDRIGNQMMAYAHWQTTMKTKTRIVTKMLESLLEDSIEIRSQVLLDELRKFRISSVSAGGHISYSGLDYPDDDVMAAMIGLYCLRETLADYRSPASQDDASRNSPSRGARPSGGGVVYGIYDPWTRQRGQTTDLRKAEELVRANPGWVIRPILVTRANTAYSVIHHGRGAENDLWRQGVDQKEITPSLVQNYRMKFDAQGKLEPVARVEYGETDADDMNAVMAGQEWESEDLE